MLILILQRQDSQALVNFPQLYNLFRYFQQLLCLLPKTIQGLVLKLYLCILKHPKEKLCCKKPTNQMPAHNFFFLLQFREFLEQPQKNAESA